MDDVFTLHRGSLPLLISLPHDGIALPEEIAARVTDAARGVPDTDWFVSRLYDFARGLGASVLVPQYSRYVVDLNRPPDDVSLYPGQNTTGLCPLTTFDNQPLYHAGREPDDAEIARRRDTYFLPYHDALASQITRLRARHGTVVVYDAHSIRSHIPHLFEGELPQFNLGTAGPSGAPDTSCDNALSDVVENLLKISGMSQVRNGRFKGGWITRHYSNIAGGVHSLQMELACRGYMHEPLPDQVDEHSWPTPLDPDHAAPLRHTLAQVLNACLEFATNRSAA